MQSNAFLYAPAPMWSSPQYFRHQFIDKHRNPVFHFHSGSVSSPALLSNIFIDSGAVIDVAGLAGVEVPVSRNEVVISPVKAMNCATVRCSAPSSMVPRFI
ncbi:MAG: hypothetical protein WDN50_06390 [Bradyrhizobium sp.]